MVPAATTGGSRAVPDFQVGERVGRWTIVGPRQRIVFPSTQQWAFPVRCDCGAERVLPKAALRSGRTLSCGCWRPAILSDQRRVHGLTHTRLHRIWVAMRRRCRLPTDTCYPKYGARGIRVCDEWQDFQTFRDWTLANGYRDDLSIDRIDGERGYSPENCRWATPTQQSNNLSSNKPREAFGERKTAREWSLDPRCQVTWSTLAGRLNHGWDVADAMTAPRYVHVHRSRPYRRGATQG